MESDASGHEGYETENDVTFDGFFEEDITDAQARFEDIQNDISSGSDIISSDDDIMTSDSDESELDNQEVLLKDFYTQNPPIWNQVLHEPATGVCLNKPEAKLPPGWPNDAKPIDYFTLFFSQSVIERLVDFTNIYADVAIEKIKESRPNYTEKIWAAGGPTHADEMRAYLGVLIAFSVNPCMQLRCAFSADPFLSNEGIKRVFTLKRFQKLNNYFALCNKRLELERDDPNYTPLNKVKFLFDSLNAAFPRYFSYPQHVVIDESMEATKVSFMYLINSIHL